MTYTFLFRPYPLQTLCIVIERESLSIPTLPCLLHTSIPSLSVGPSTQLHQECIHIRFEISHVSYWYLHTTLKNFWLTKNLWCIDVGYLGSAVGLCELVTAQFFLISNVGSISEPVRSVILLGSRKALNMSPPGLRQGIYQTREIQKRNKMLNVCSGGCCQQNILASCERWLTVRTVRRPTSHNVFTHMKILNADYYWNFNIYISWRKICLTLLKLLSSGLVRMK